VGPEGPKSEAARGGVTKQKVVKITEKELWRENYKRGVVKKQANRAVHGTRKRRDNQDGPWSGCPC